MEKLNRKSDFLVLLLASYNRLELLKKSIDSIVNGTKCDYEIIVLDGGSTDGSIEYLKLRKDITPIFQGELLGVAKAYNDVWQKIDCKYTCWLSDDTEVTPGTLDLAVKILGNNADIGMVGLKMKDTLGPGSKHEYMGGISNIGVLNCNHGVLSYQLLKSLGYFNEAYVNYTVDSDLTTSVLASGKKVVMTKKIGVLHHREWALKEKMSEKFKRMGVSNSEEIFRTKFKFIEEAVRPKPVIVRRGINFTVRNLMKIWPSPKFLGATYRDWLVMNNTNFIGLLDTVKNIGKPYHLVQKIPLKILSSSKNSYRHLLA